MAKGWQGLVTREDGQQVFACPEPNCYYRVLLTAHSGTEHKCPHIGPTTIGWSVGKTLVQQVWDMLDETVKHIKEDLVTTESDQFEKLKKIERARALADVLAIFMVPHFRTSEDISREANRRYKAAKEGDTTYETPGLGSLKYLPPPGSDPNRGRQTPKAPAASAKPTHNLTPDEVAGIKAAGAAQFPVADLARTFKVSVAVIDSILSS